MKNNKLVIAVLVGVFWLSGCLQKIPPHVYTITNGKTTWYSRFYPQTYGSGRLTSFNDCKTGYYRVEPTETISWSNGPDNGQCK